MTVHLVAVDHNSTSVLHSAEISNANAACMFIRNLQEIALAEFGFPSRFEPQIVYFILSEKPKGPLFTVEDMDAEITDLPWWFLDDVHLNDRRFDKYVDDCIPF